MLIRRELPPEGAKAVGSRWVTSTGVVYESRGDHVVRLERKDLVLARKAWGRDKGPVPLERRRGKIDAKAAAYIKGQLAVGCNLTWLAQKFGVTPQAIHKIMRGKLWAHLETPVLDLDGPPKGTHLTPDIVAYYNDVYEG